LQKALKAIRVAFLTLLLPQMNNPISFDNTEIAFAYKTDKELKQSRWLFALMGQSWLVQLGTRVTPWSIRAGLPVKGLIRQTIFKQFVGGETLEETVPVAQKLAKYGVGAILDYGVEGSEGETSYDQATQEFIRVIRFASGQPNIPFMSVKLTGMSRFSLLERIHDRMQSSGPSLIARYESAIASLPPEEQQEWQRVVGRMQEICQVAAASGVGFLVDAEESWIQDGIDALTMLLMDHYNKEKVIVYNTIQLYRHDRLNFFIQSHEAARERGFVLGAKIVRGAYMEKERKRAAEKGYASPIQPSKEATDRDYNEALKYAIDHIEGIGLIVASHNEYSNLLATQLMQQKGLPFDHHHIHFSQLYGMSDNITYNLAQGGCSVSKYLPFGPIEDVIPYLMRRAQENTSVGGQTSRELGLIDRELKRRKI